MCPVDCSLPSRAFVRNFADQFCLFFVANSEENTTKLRLSVMRQTYGTGSKGLCRVYGLHEAGLSTAIVPLCLFPVNTAQDDTIDKQVRIFFILRVLFFVRDYFLIFFDRKCFGLHQISPPISSIFSLYVLRDIKEIGRVVCKTTASEHVWTTTLLVMTRCEDLFRAHRWSHFLCTAQDSILA